MTQTHDNQDGTGKVKSLLTERGKTHGEFSRHAAATVALKITMMQFVCSYDQFLEPYQQEALDMIAHKIGRILAGDPDFADHWRDIAGYATLVAERCSK